MQSSNTNKTGVDFYLKARKEYESATPKPFNYEFNLVSNNPKPKKFKIIINKFVQIFKQSMKSQFQDEDELSYNYWNQLQKYFGGLVQMKFMIDKIYEKKNVKLRIFFTILLHTKTLFDRLKEIIKNLPHLYKNPQQKLMNFQKDIEPINFLRDGQYQILSDEYVGQFNKFKEARLEQQIRKKRQIQQQAKRKKQEEQDLRRENQEKQRKERQIKLIEQAKKAKQAQEKTIKPYQVQNKVGGTTQKPPTTPLSKPILKVEQKIKPKHLKNSEHLYDSTFKDEFQVFQYHDQPSVSKQKTNCFECKKVLSQGFYFLGGNCNYCNYTGQWFCNDDMADERIAIPFKAKLDFDLRGYSVSKRALEEIKNFYDKPIIKIEIGDKVVKQNRKLYEFLVLKRQVHLMYDSICNVALMQRLLSSRLNYFLKENLFSLKNLYDIYNGHETQNLDREYNFIARHFINCETCQDRKGHLCGECGHPPKIFAFQLKDTYSCKHCRKIYHRMCLQNKTRCPCEEI